eukprot:CAMPEP_0176446468 /NCGR_PEP_ID=MMETSP0127-20121128/24348_1 /TAXON_ID=938130 /ORGANISM="Platyophrya macrostoma, Strain WH" /LENGTH=258 /DNA_ID=CAMNT_0017832517 /DNA_START=74 /DNA_END=852 /DNA_ORIENTATION=-
MPMQRTSVEVVDADFKFVAEVPISQIATGRRPTSVLPQLPAVRGGIVLDGRRVQVRARGRGPGDAGVAADPREVRVAQRGAVHVPATARRPRAQRHGAEQPASGGRDPDEQILVTQGALNEDPAAGPLSHCAHYYFNRMCNRGERCNFIHAVHVDPTIVSDFERISARHVGTCALLPAKRRGHGRSAKTFSEADVDEESDDALIAIADAEHVCGLSQLSSGESDDARQQCEDVIPPRRSATMRFRHDPYSFNFVRVVV